MNLTWHSSSAGVPLAAAGVLAPIIAGLMAELACRSSGRASAAARHLFWTLAFVMMAVCVPATFFPFKVTVPILPAKPAGAIRFVLPRLAAKDSNGARASDAAMGISEPKSEMTPGIDSATQTPSAMAHFLRAVPWQGALLSLWFLGFLFLLFTVLLGTLRLQGIVKRARFAEDRAALWAELLSSTGPRRPARLLVSAEVRMPIAAGFFRPIVILPEAALHWPAQMFRAALVHELAHLRRNDLLFSMFARLVVSIYWFNPAAWYGLRSLQGQAEMAADDEVVVTESEPIAYAESLVMLVRTLRGNDGSLFPAIGMLQDRGIAARVERILDGGRHRLGPSRFVRTGTIFCGALATAIVSMVRPVAALTPPVPSAMLAAKVGAPKVIDADTPDKGEAATKTESGEGPAITDLRTQLPGTRWEAAPGNLLRGGLTAVLNFTEKTVNPAGYPYEVNHHDSTVRIYFNHGDTQLLLLTNDGRRLRFTFGGKDYVYALTAK